MKPIYKKIQALQIAAYDRAFKSQHRAIREERINKNGRAVQRGKVKKEDIIENFHNIVQAAVYIYQARPGKKGQMVREYIRYLKKMGWLSEGTPLSWYFGAFSERLCRAAIWITHGKGKVNKHMFYAESFREGAKIDWPFYYET